MLEIHLEGSPLEILERLDLYLNELIFSNLDIDNSKYKVHKFNFDADTKISSLDLVPIDMNNSKNYTYRLRLEVQ